jgi:hypothetical protein
VADDRNSWGKTSAWTWGLAMCEESPNGGVEQQLVGGKGMAAAHLNMGKSYEKGRKLQPVGRFYTPEEREGCVVPHVGD